MMRTEGQAFLAADDSRRRDREARQAAQRRFDRPLVLEAGAGTGKTTTLIARLLVWCLGPGWERAVQRQAARKAEQAAASGPSRRKEPDSPERLAADVLGRVVAITFTEAAAAEMAQRASRELGSLARGETPAWLDETHLPASPDERSRRARALLGTLDHLSVRTIHAFCLGLLADHPLEAGVHPLLTVDADGRLVEEVVREAVEAALRQGYGDPGDPHLLALAVRGFGAREIIDALVTLVHSGLPSRALREDPFGPAVLAAFRDRLIGACAEVHRLLGPRLRGFSRRSNAPKVAEGVAALLGRLRQNPEGTEATGGPPDLAVWQRWAAELLPENLTGHMGDKWGRGKLKGAEADQFGDVADELRIHAGALHRLLEHLAALDPELLDHARQALAPLLAQVERDLQARGVTTFDALLTGAARFLQEKPAERRRVRRGIDQLLVDEFQDTDRVQCEILRWLALDGGADERPGLFLVGDPKQSIYGWRSADLRAYGDFVARVRAAGGEVMSLVENFRSVPAILDEVTRVIAPVMRERPGLQPPFEELLPCERRAADPGFLREGWAPVEHWVSWRETTGEGREAQGGGKTPSGVAAELEAEALAADVRALHDREQVPWRNMAVLLRGIGDLDVYLESLRRAGVPFQVGKDRQYYRRREVIEAAALVRAVVDPGDHLALLTVLRSSLAGVPDAALIPLWNREFPRRMTELSSPDPKALQEIADLVREAARRVPTDVPGIERVRGWEAGLLAAVEHLAVLRRSFDADPSDVFVERLRRLTLIEPVEAARYLGPYRLANLDRFFRQLLTAIEDGGGDVTAILRALRKSVAEAREAEEGRPQEGVEDAVQVLTVHGSKGLDFQHVYLVQLHKAPPGGDRGGRTEVGRIEDHSDGEGASPRFEYRLFGAATLGFDRVEAERREVEAAERVRLLYVAMTRAKDRLVLAGTWPDEPEPRPAEQARSAMELLCSRAVRPGDLGARWEEAAGNSLWSFLDEAGALWKFPALRPAAEILAADDTFGPDLPEPEQVARMAAQLREKRAWARARMARRFSGAASEEAHELLREEQAEARVSGSGEEAVEKRPARPWLGKNAELDREAAMAAGGAIHRVLETWDLAADPRKEAGRQRSLLPEYLAALAEGEILDRALPKTLTLLDLFLESPLLQRFQDLRDHVLARELTVLLPPGQGESSPVGVVSGAIDLLYRDPGTSRLVIADYKTDEVEDEEALHQRAAIYGHQGRVYVRALKDALELEEEPRFELWFLRRGWVVGVGDPNEGRTR